MHGIMVYSYGYNAGFISSTVGSTWTPRVNNLHLCLVPSGVATGMACMACGLRLVEQDGLWTVLFRGLGVKGRVAVR